MSWSLHKLLGNKYPIYYCQTCEKSFEHPRDEYPEACHHCGGWDWIPKDGFPPCSHEGHREILSHSDK